MTARPTAPCYSLSCHAHTCICGDRLLIMDLQSGQYYGLNLADARALAEWIRGWPVAGGDSREPKALRQLLDAGLLTEDHALGRDDATPVRSMEPVESLADRPLSRRPQIRARHVIEFLIAAAGMSLALRCFTLKHILSRARRRKQHGQNDSFDLDATQELVSIFHRLSPWFFGRRDECLRNSLMLLQFLARYRLYPDMVFAVRGTPFSAHCWLQHAGVVLNDSVVKTAPLTPIMVV